MQQLWLKKDSFKNDVNSGLKVEFNNEKETMTKKRQIKNVEVQWVRQWAPGKPYT